jgi:hypothetical protein
MASQFLPLLHCPLCLSPLTSPVTLFCGHTVCSMHVSVPAVHIPSSAQSTLHLPLTLLRLTPCPLERCTASPSAPTPLPNIPSSSRVIFYPAPGLQPGRDAAAFATIPDSRTDITLNKLANIIRRHDHLQAQSTQHLPPLGSDPGSDSQTDDEISDSRRSFPTQAFTPGSSTRIPGQVSTPSSSSSSPSDLPQASSDRSPRGPARTSARKRPRLDAPPQSSDQFEKELLAELGCEICLNLLYQPVTSPCQHVTLLVCSAAL